MSATTTTLPVGPARKPSSATYVKYELLRAFRNKRFMIFSLAFPLVLFYLVAGPNRNQKLGGINFAIYYMSGMLAYGSMAAVLSGGGRIAQERSVGWHRQIRITPLSTRTYFATKILSGYAIASLSIILLYLAGTSVGVRLSAPHWLELTGYVLVALIPFAVIGIVLGHLLTVDSMGPAMGGITALFSLLGGAWGPLAAHGWLHSVVEWLPSYWLVQAGKTTVGGGAWPAKAWIVIAVWTVVMTRIAVAVYQRDTKRV
jgi:ABC-2 type transport system permease protein